jgi:drug/metabolite transporter (DMT)-like permease
MKILKYFIPYALIGSFAYYFAKDGIVYSSPYVFMAIRFFISFIIVYLLGGRLIFNRDIILLSIFTFSSTTFWILGLEFVTPGQSAILSYTMPLFSIPLSIIILKEKPTSLEYLGTFIGFIGVVTYSIPFLNRGFELLGSILTIINAFFWGLFTVYFRKLKNFDAKSVNSTQFFICTIFFSIVSLMNHRIYINFYFMIDILYMSILGGAVLFYLWNTMVRIEKVAKVTVFAFSVPTLAQIYDILVLGIYPTSLQILGSLIIFLGIFISRINEFKNKYTHLKK